MWHCGVTWHPQGHMALLQPHDTLESRDTPWVTWLCPGHLTPLESCDTRGVTWHPGVTWLFPGHLIPLESHSHTPIHVTALMWHSPTPRHVTFLTSHAPIPATWHPQCHVAPPLSQVTSPWCWGLRTNKVWSQEILNIVQSCNEDEIGPWPVPGTSWCKNKVS